MPGGWGWPRVTLADGTRAINLPGPVLTLQLNEGWRGCVCVWGGLGAGSPRGGPVRGWGADGDVRLC